ncbi:MAG: CapA family protein [Candidatus Gracilibacteria bacterium]|nr:CapA family protein [Candidatus Gracilibacteria bacterium]
MNSIIILLIFVSGFITNQEVVDSQNIGRQEEISDIHISFLGDVMIGGRVKDEIYKNGMEVVFGGSRKYLQEKDAVVLNLETTVTDTGKKQNKTYTFKADKKHLVGLKQWNKNIFVNLANNHAGDYGVEGMKNTMSNLQEAGIEYFGIGNNISEAHQVKIFTLQETKIGLIGQNCVSPQSFSAQENKVGIAFFDKELLKKEVIGARKQGVDIIVLNAHCGVEYTNGPSKKQQDYYHYAIDVGVDLVIGHHPHWYQGIEKYKGKIIFYSLGDYIFDIFRGRRTQEGIIADVEIRNKKIQKIIIQPVHIYGFGKTELATKKQEQFILDELQILSDKLSDIKTISQGYIFLESE